MTREEFLKHVDESNIELEEEEVIIVWARYADHSGWGWDWDEAVEHLADQFGPNNPVPIPPDDPDKLILVQDPDTLKWDLMKQGNVDDTLIREDEPLCEVKRAS